MKSLSKFHSQIWEYYHNHARTDLPWRHTHDPYKIMVSEIMLQQTQVQRAMPKYIEFTNKFPTVEVLAHAKLADVIIVWQGLGYNRRAKYLHESANKIVENNWTHPDAFPKDVASLVTLPGIGQNTASAIIAYSFNLPVVFIETNIRAVYQHHFFKNIESHDRQLLELVTRSMEIEKANSRSWYWALMDYGTHIKKRFGNPNTQNSSYVKQAKFKGSTRELRGKILKQLSNNVMVQKNQLLHTIDDQRTDTILKNLQKEGLIVLHNDHYQLGNE